MRSTLLLTVFTAGLALATTAELAAHGGEYHGPGDVVPPHPGGGGRTPRPTGPGGPSGGGPVTPRAPLPPGGGGAPGAPGTGGVPGPGGGGPGGPRSPGAGLPEDLSRWSYWWEFNKAPFIRLKEAIADPGQVTRGGAGQYLGAGERVLTKDTLRPTRAEIRRRILPPLAGALEGTTQRDIVSSCLVAMAKIGVDTESIHILPAFAERLRSKDQEVRETAALSFGISQRTEAVGNLIELVTDSDAGRRLCDRSEVDDRTRSFAAYGLGLIGYATSDTAVKQKAFVALRTILEDQSIVDRNVRVAAIHAMGLLRPDATDPAGRALFFACDDALTAYWDQKLGVGEQLIQAHVPTSVAKLLGPDPSDDDEIAARRSDWRRAWLGQVTGDAKVVRENDTITQSAILALGRTTAPFDDETKTAALDRDVSLALQRYYQRGKNQQARYFALIALGQIGGEKNRTFLMTALATGQKVLEKPWAAIALGVMVHDGLEAHGPDAADPGVGGVLLDEFRHAAAPDARSALAIALGLAGYREAAPVLRDLLAHEQHQDELAGYLCIGLALMDDDHATEQIRGLVADSVRRPLRLQQGAVALGKLGDKHAAELLIGLMSNG